MLLLLSLFLEIAAVPRDYGFPLTLESRQNIWDWVSSPACCQKEESCWMWCLGMELEKVAGRRPCEQFICNNGFHGLEKYCHRIGVIILNLTDCLFKGLVILLTEIRGGHFLASALWNVQMSSPTMVSVFQKESGCNLASEVLCDESSLLEESTYITGRLVPLSQYIQNETESGLNLLTTAKLQYRRRKNLSSKMTS